MSKSIHEEALLDLRMNDSMRVAGQHVLTREQYSNIFKALEQAQKQEKLLGLYRELSIKERKRATTLKTKNVDKYNQLNKEIEIINEHIKELESDN